MAEHSMKKVTDTHHDAEYIYRGRRLIRDDRYRGYSGYWHARMPAYLERSSYDIQSLTLRELKQSVDCALEKMENELADVKPVHEYAFDFQLQAAMRIKATSSAEAQEIIKKFFDALECVGGDGWIAKGQKSVFEASMAGPLTLFEIDGEQVQQQIAKSMPVSVFASGEASKTEDSSVPGIYEYEIVFGDEIDLLTLSDDQKSAIASAVLDRFHAEIPVGVLDDFVFEVTTASGEILTEAETRASDHFIAHINYHGHRSCVRQVETNKA